jgi:hypothetical protein
VAHAATGGDVRARLAEHGYSLFLRPDRPSGWWVALRNSAPGAQAPIEARAATRAEAVALAERLFVNHRLAELDRTIRDAGLQPPFWAERGQRARLDALQAFAREHDLA